MKKLPILSEGGHRGDHFLWKTNQPPGTTISLGFQQVVCKTQGTTLINIRPLGGGFGDHKSFSYKKLDQITILRFGHNFKFLNVE